jgi:ribosomal protein S18 acetylase RimI-like enzyme
MIRKAVPADVPEIERVMRASMADLGTRFYDAAQVASAVRYIAVVDRQLIDDGTYFVIEEQSAEGRAQSAEVPFPPTGPGPFPLPSALCALPSRIIACGGWSGRTKLFSGPRSQDEAGASDGRLDPAVHPARIRAMFVDPAHARRGLGRQILEASEADAARTGFRTFELMATLPGVPLYCACGYEEIERVTIELPDGMRLDCIRMERAPSTADRRLPTAD